MASKPTSGVKGLSVEALAFRDKVVDDIRDHPGTTLGMVAMRLGSTHRRVDRFARTLIRYGVLTKEPCYNGKLNVVDEF